MRLIDADALRAKLTDYNTILADPNADISSMTVAAKIVEEAPTVDAVQVVRCRECVYNWKGGSCLREKADPNWFCAFGKRREEPVDTVTVVRCKDCKWKCDCGYKDGDWYCADGER